MQQMMESPEFLQQMAGAMSNPAIVDQMIAMNPELAPMAGQLRAMFQSERFRQVMCANNSIASRLELANACAFL
jgi:ubiquilin